MALLSFFYDSVWYYNETYLDVLVRAQPDNAERVYRALAAFGAPRQAFEVDTSDFATYG